MDLASGQAGAARDTVFYASGPSMAIDNLWRTNQTTLNYRLETPSDLRMIFAPPSECGAASVSFVGSWCRTNCDLNEPRIASLREVDRAELQLLTSDREPPIFVWNVTVREDHCCISASVDEKLPTDMTAIIFETAVLQIKLAWGMSDYYVSAVGLMYHHHTLPPPPLRHPLSLTTRPPLSTSAVHQHTWN